MSDQPGFFDGPAPGPFTAPDAPTWDAFGGHEATVGDAYRMGHLVDRAQKAFADDVDAMLLTGDDIEALCDLWTMTTTAHDKLAMAMGVASCHAAARAKLTVQVKHAEAMASRYACLAGYAFGLAAALGGMLLWVTW